MVRINLIILAILSCFMVGCKTKQVVPDSELQNYGDHEFHDMDIIEVEGMDN